jgi:hypothetical protein
MIDISGLDFDALPMIFKQIDMQKILFGSDALYHRQWAGLVRSMYALEKSHEDIEYNFAQIVSINPAKHIFDECRI